MKTFVWLGIQEYEQFVNTSQIRRLFISEQDEYELYCVRLQFVDGSWITLTNWLSFEDATDFLDEYAQIVAGVAI